jgi:hypothetical protein
VLGDFIRGKIKACCFLEVGEERNPCGGGDSSLRITRERLAVSLIKAFKASKNVRWKAAPDSPSPITWWKRNLTIRERKLAPHSPPRSMLRPLL